jgi:uncharacterized protein (TIGR03067 family)
MKNAKKQLGALWLGAAIAVVLTPAYGADVEPGFKSLFNGKDLTGWAGRTVHWSVEDGAITGTTTKENPAQGNNFLIAKDGDHNLIVGDFEIRFSFRFTGEWGNSGLQYRSLDKGNFVVNGYQADFEVGTSYSGILYEEGGRGILCERGRQVVIKEVDGKTKIEVVGFSGDSKEIQNHIQVNGWNDYVITAQGNHLTHFINGLQTADVVDEQTSKAAQSGILALQLHAGPPMKVQFKNLRIKFLSGQSAVRSDLELIQGEWVPAEIVANGEKVSGDVLASMKLKIKGNDYALDTADGLSEGTFKLKENAQPKLMDVTTSSGDEIPAIYELSGDTMRVCYALNGAARATELKSTEASNHFLTVYKRKKP